MSRPVRFFVLCLPLLAALSATGVRAQAPSQAARVHPDAAWADLKDPARRIAIRDGKLWLIESGRVRIGFPVVGGTEERLEVCMTDARVTLSLEEAGTTMTLKGPIQGEFHRLSGMPPELDLRPAPLGTPRPLPAGRLAEIQAELARRGELDQRVRTGESHETQEMTRVDGDNTAYFQRLAAEVGWIDRARFGADAALTAFLIVQHSGDIPLMLAALPEIRREVDPREPKNAAAGFYALLYDRLTLTLGGLQRYGSQIGVQPSGREVLRPLEDPEHVDERRKDLGMEPLAAYVGRFGVSELPRIDEHCREVGFIKAEPAPAGGAGGAPVSGGASAAGAGSAPPSASPPAGTSSAAATRSPTEALRGAWQEGADPSHRIALRDGRLWIAEKGRLARALPVVGSEPGRLWTCWKDGNRRAFDVAVEGGVATLKGLEDGSYERLEAMPSELVLLPLDWPQARALPAAEVARVQKELAQRSRYAKLPLGSREALDRSKIEDLDSESSAALRQLGGQVGWIDEPRFGPEAARNALTIVQHSSDLRLIQTALPEIRKTLAAHPDPALADLYARLYDRFQLATGGLQRYGTQVGLLVDRTQVVRPLEDPKNVDARRREIGLDTLADELARAGAAEALILDARCLPWTEAAGR